MNSNTQIVISTDLETQLSAAVKAFEEVQAKYNRYGAQDTETYAEFHYIIRCALDKKDVEWRKVNWSLFNEKGKGLAARELTKAARVVYKLTKKVRNELASKMKTMAWR